MNKWTPISLSELYDEIHKAEVDLIGEPYNFWELIKIDPAKWMLTHWGDYGGGFWVVAICGVQVIWYNDIECGFNISNYKRYGEIGQYYCNQDTLSEVVVRLFDLVKLGGNLSGHRGPPQNLTF